MGEVQFATVALVTRCGGPGSRKLGESLPPEGRIRQLVAAWLDVSEQQARAGAAQADLLDAALTELAEWADPNSVEARVAELRAAAESAAREKATTQRADQVITDDGADVIIHSGGQHQGLRLQDKDPAPSGGSARVIVSLPL